MGLIKELNQEYQSKFISIREAFEAIKEVFPTTTEAEIAQLLIRVENDSVPHKAMLNGLTNEIISIEPFSDESLEYKHLLEVIISRNLPLEELENLDSSYYRFEEYPMEDPLWFDTRDLDNLGWYREGFNEALKKNGLDIEAIQQQKSKEPPAWFKPKHLMPYLSLNEAAFTIAFCEEFPNHREFSRDALDSRFLCDIGEYAYRELLRQAVDQGRISLSPKHGSRTDPESQWQLDVLDIRQYCHESGLNWPIPWEEPALIINDPDELIDWPLPIEQIPAWLKPYMARAYLSLEEASDIITRCDFYDDEEDRDGFYRAFSAYKEMLRRNVMEGLIRLSPNAGNVTDYEEYWQLDVNDIGKLCSTINILWPISYVKNEANTNSNQTVVNDPEFNARLEELKAANEALKAENEALKKQLSGYCIVPINSEYFPLEAKVGLKLWNTVTENGKQDVIKKSPKQALEAELERMTENDSDTRSLTKSAKERILTVFNWRQGGGNPRLGV
ncbi:Uncharacterised protein [Oligella ureolytica]|uniref:Uncharacterized protein n=1 Tax=Oligella ureolytica TaxID=90244 RepID=A0A378XDE8_9BURK|nr:hypothetical protein [Oligella ureolytica]QPT40922.1 hypothetical protein I6G29_05025 [Oligella ureolytica]SUA53188.1 Uncharacterised protein [Oligella ureolytica]SUA57612.1 Uncharacterised protein [Oligella ureolytica]